MNQHSVKLQKAVAPTKAAASSTGGITLLPLNVDPLANADRPLLTSTCHGSEEVAKENKADAEKAAKAAKAKANRRGGARPTRIMRLK
eukprot:1331998-Pleurochrysis_carterae.AAC.1